MLRLKHVGEDRGSFFQDSYENSEDDMNLELFPPVSIDFRYMSTCIQNKYKEGLLFILIFCRPYGLCISELNRECNLCSFFAYTKICVS